jgi:hypothetical protein
VLNTVRAAAAVPEAAKAKAALQQGDSVAAMEAYAKLAARHEQVRTDKEKEDADARMEMLNETSFDRRRQLAVYKQDGKRGHHMQVPPTPPQGTRPTSSRRLSCQQCPVAPWLCVFSQAMLRCKTLLPVDRLL